MRDSYTNPYETKRIEPFWLFFFTKRIHKTNLLNSVVRNESTKRIFWTPKDKTNPRNKSFEHRRTKRIHETNLLKTRGFANPNPKDSDGFVYPLVLRIREDLLDSLDSSNLLKIASQNESTKQIFWKLRQETNPQNESFENCITKRTRESNFLKTDELNRNESMDSRILTFLSYLFSLVKYFFIYFFPLCQ